jgi:putative transposase
MKSELLEFNGADDHVHLLVCCSPTVAICNLVSKLKGKSSYFLRKEFSEKLSKKLWRGHLWSPSYCVVSCGEASLDVVKQYIVEQRTPGKERDVKRSVLFTGRKRDENKCWLA